MSNLKALIDKIDSYGFECKAGPLTLCTDWMKLRVHAELMAQPAVSEPVGVPDDHEI